MVKIVWICNWGAVGTQPHDYKIERRERREQEERLTAQRYGNAASQGSHRGIPLGVSRWTSAMRCVAHTAD